MSDRSFAAALLSFGFPLVAIAFLGCESGTDGAVTGRVTYRQQPVSFGIVNFYAPSKGAAAQADLDESGRFVLPAHLPAGVYKVAVMPPLPEQLPPGSPPPPAKPFHVPLKYQDAARTPIEQDVKAGENELVIELTD